MVVSPRLLLLLVSKFNIKYLLPGREKTNLPGIPFFLFSPFPSICHEDSTRCRIMKRIQKTKNIQIKRQTKKWYRSPNVVTEARKRQRRSFAANIFLQLTSFEADF